MTSFTIQNETYESTYITYNCVVLTMKMVQCLNPLVFDFYCRLQEKKKKLTEQLQFFTVMLRNIDILICKSAIIRART